MMKRYGLMLSVLAILGTAFPQAASSQDPAAQLGTFPKTVRQIFARAASAGVYTVEGFPGCTYGVLFIPLNTEGGRSMLALVTAAKAAGWKITAIEHTSDANGVCTASGLFVQ